MRAVRSAVLGIVIALMTGLLPEPAAAHSGLRVSMPLDGATLGDSPEEILLSFVERPEPALSTIEVLDTAGTAYHGDRPAAVPGDPLSLRMPVRRLGRGIYTVKWRVVSAVDGHASAGSFAFGVLVAPTALDTAPAAQDQSGSAGEGVSRTIFLAGVVLLLGGAGAWLGRFGGHSALRLAAAGAVASGLGVAFLGWIQQRTANVSLSQLLSTAVGRALLWRAVAVAIAVAALVIAIRARRAGRGSVVRAGAILIALATVAAIAAHSSIGHAAAVPGRTGVSIAFQIAHTAFAALWLGGLAVLLFEMSRAESETVDVAVRRFSAVAAAGLAVVGFTGLVRLVDEIATPQEMLASTYGRVLAAKVFIFLAIAGLGAMNRFRHVPVVGRHPGRLRRGGAIELGLAAAALTAAGFLGALPPPAAARDVAGLVATGEDYGTTIRVRFTAASDQPGPNRFALEVLDFDSRVPVADASVMLRFTAVDDPRHLPVTLRLAHERNGLYAGSGAPMAFEGRWAIAALVERGGNSVTSPMIVETRGLPPFISVLRPPGGSPTYTIRPAQTKANVSVSAVPNRPGANAIAITFFDGIMEPLPTDEAVIIVGEANAGRQLPVRRVGPNAFVADGVLQAGENRLAIIGRTAQGTRVRAALWMPIDH